MSDAPFIDPDDADPDAHDAATESDRLNQQHIRSILAEKRANDRHRTYLLLGAIVCAVAAVQLVWIAIPQFRIGITLEPVSGFIVATGCAWAAWKLFARAAAVRKELQQTPKATQMPPDFSTLNDGSQLISNLENIEDDE